MSDITHESVEFEARLLSRIEESGIAGGGLHLYTNVTAKERRLIRKFERIKLVSITQSWARLTPAGQSRLSAFRLENEQERSSD